MDKVLWFNGPYWYEYDEPLIRSIGQGPKFTHSFVLGESLIVSSIAKQYIVKISLGNTFRARITPFFKLLGGL